MLSRRLKAPTKSFLLQGLSEPEFHSDLVYKFRKIVRISEFSDHFSKIAML